MTYNLKLERPWEEVKEKLKEADSELSDEDLKYEPGKENELLGRVGKKIKKSIDETKKWIESVAGNEGKAS
ncbi:CsbD family protein [Ferruginibacter albus]|uniref:general stress protein CsbD n=1 Tax=Ferruginibacter albus TaxID=2875540 RepID=UPI001CC68BD8|nr:general stress protein CsbD [Ferruginibacter albus]UAY52197.1 general stress protein CsbD [Ferruginibacter albus]